MFGKRIGEYEGKGENLCFYKTLPSKMVMGENSSLPETRSSN